MAANHIKTHYIYIPGLGDRMDPLRRIALLRWKSKNTRATLVPMRWSNASETYEHKYKRLKTIIEQSKAGRVVLVGESAGASMALLAFARLQESAQNVITVCGYNHGSADIHEHHRRNSPAFFAAVKVTEKLIDTLSSPLRKRVTTVYSTKDTVVEPHHTKIRGAKKIELYSQGHLQTIARVLLCGPKHIDKEL